jgi:hypothetical protein
MKYLVVLLFASALFAFCQESPDALTAKAIDGAKELYSGLRDPDSFKLDKAWAMHSEKHGDAVCYVYYARNGFGGMNHSAASFAPNKKGEYILTLASGDWCGPKGNINAPFPGGFEYFSRCGERAEKHDKLVKDFTADVEKSLTSK